MSETTRDAAMKQIKWIEEAIAERDTLRTALAASQAEVERLTAMLVGIGHAALGCDGHPCRVENLAFSVDDVASCVGEDERLRESLAQTQRELQEAAQEGKRLRAELAFTNEELRAWVKLASPGEIDREAEIEAARDALFEVFSTSKNGDSFLLAQAATAVVDTLARQRRAPRAGQDDAQARREAQAEADDCYNERALAGPAGTNTNTPGVAQGDVAKCASQRSASAGSTPAPGATPPAPRKGGECEHEWGSAFYPLENWKPYRECRKCDVRRLVEPAPKPETPERGFSALRDIPKHVDAMPERAFRHLIVRWADDHWVCSACGIRQDWAAPKLVEPPPLSPPTGPSDEEIRACFIETVFLFKSEYENLRRIFASHRSPAAAVRIPSVRIALPNDNESSAYVNGWNGMRSVTIAALRAAGVPLAEEKGQ